MPSSPTRSRSSRPASKDSASVTFSLAGVFDRNTPVFRLPELRTMNPRLCLALGETS